MIIRRKVTRNFTVVPSEPINDKRLSFEDLGLLTYLLSRPNDWHVRLEQLRERGDVGRQKIQQMMRRLIECGFVIREQVRSAENRQFGSYEYVVYDVPQCGT